jgi:hypothetical protein
MKLVVPSACLIAGIAIGWVARPMGDHGDKGAVAAVQGADGGKRAPGEPAAAAPEERERAGSRASDRSAKKPGEATAKITGSPEQQEAIKNAQEQMGKRMTDAQRKKFEARLVKLTAELNLTPEQQQAVRDAMEKRFDAFGSMFGMGTGDDHSTEKMKDRMALMKGDGVDEALSGMLQGDQLAQYQEVKAKEQKTRSEAKALKDLSNLSSVIDDLTQTQRDAIYQNFTDQAAKAPAPGAMSQFYEGMGVQMDDELGMQDMMENHMESFGEDGNPTDMQKIMKDAMDQKIDARMDALKGNLTDAQMQQYRAHLEEKASSMMAMFGGVSGQAPAASEGKTK